MGLAGNLKRVRAAKGLQQTELAEAVGISEITLRKYEAGDRYPKDPTIEALASELGVTKEALVSDCGATLADAVQTLFDIEELYGLKPIKVDGMVVLAMPEDTSDAEQEQLAKALHAWYRNRRALDENEISESEYYAWKDAFKA